MVCMRDRDPVPMDDGAAEPAAHGRSGTSLRKALSHFMDAPLPSLTDLGWSPFFSSQVTEEELRTTLPVRVMAVYRGLVSVMGATFEGLISSRLPEPGGPGSRDPEDRPAVGDWLLVGREDHEALRLLQRASLFKRPAPGNDRRVQLMAANVDTLFIVTSCNQDFNIPRLERYLVLAREVGVRPVLILTKIDLAEDPGSFRQAALELQPDLEIEMINAKDPQSAAHLAERCALGETVALMGSSGVGKSTLVNTLRGSDRIVTQAVREQDGKGRHTTTVREMHRLEGGGWLMDTPGMREFKLAEVATGLAEVFDDIALLGQECRFSNCGHQQEPGCAIQAAVKTGTLDTERLERWRKLSAEDLSNSAGLPERRGRERK
ncbi:MAG: rsgA [Novosphingobium lindaniclasticum]|nr:rsgA [Novosphingobium lindaniclasticum]